MQVEAVRVATELVQVRSGDGGERGGRVYAAGRGRAVQRRCWPSLPRLSPSNPPPLTSPAQRLPNLVELLQSPSGDLSSCAAVRQGYALALRHSLMHPAAIDNLEEGPGEGKRGEGRCVRAMPSL